MLKQQGAAKLDQSLVSLLSTDALETLKNTDSSQWNYIWFKLLI